MHHLSSSPSKSLKPSGKRSVEVGALSLDRPRYRHENLANIDADGVPPCRKLPYTFVDGKMLSSPPLPKLSTFLLPSRVDSPTNEPLLAFSPGRREESSSIDSESSVSVFDSSPANAAGSSPAARNSDKPVRIRGRKSRYLSEADRRDIVNRINAGEKQITLAKEYCVSRAAVCNLYKHWKQMPKRSNQEIGSRPAKRRTSSDASDATSTVGYSPAGSSMFVQLQQQLKDQEHQSYNWEAHQGYHTSPPPLAKSKHSPIRPSFHDVASVVPADKEISKIQTPVSSNWASYVPFRVHEASASSLAIRRLVGDLRDGRCVGDEFRKYASRLMRLLIEEALTLLPSHDVEVQTSCGDICRVARPMEEHAICGITMEQSPAYLFEAFSIIQPNAPSGFVEVDRPISTDDAFRKSSSTNSQLPRMNSRNVTMLLDVECATGAEACAALQHLVNACAVDPRTIYFVTVISSQPGLQFIHEAYPDVNLITAQMDATLDDENRIRPGLPGFRCL